MTPIERAREAAWKACGASADGNYITAYDFEKGVDAYEAALSADGWVRVPREATEEMADAVRGMLATEFRCSPEFPLGAMLDAMGRLPKCLTAEERALTHIPPKRWRAAMLYRAMIQAVQGDGT